MRYELEVFGQIMMNLDSVITELSVIEGRLHKYRPVQNFKYHLSEYLDEDQVHVKVRINDADVFFRSTNASYTAHILHDISKQIKESLKEINKEEGDN